jgi:acetylornithine deacetylase/succinyl-diaminopimelate desuccinylase-like protein
VPSRVSEETFIASALPVLEQYAAIPCLSPSFDAGWSANGHLERAAELFAGWATGLAIRGATVSIRRLEGRTPMLVVDVPATADADGTVLIYGHLDKQPALGEWGEGLAPFAPVRRDDRLFARGVADDGYALFTALLGVAALDRDGTRHGRVVVLIEASEESSSPDLEAHLDALGDELSDVDLLVCLDSGALTYDRLWITTSLRGMVIVTLSIEVLEHGVHSGVAGGVVPSSFRILRELLDRIEHPRTGEVLLRELHAKIPDRDLAAAGLVAKDLGDPAASDLPILEGVELLGRDGADRLIRRTWEPAVSVIGMGGIPGPGDAANVLRPGTTAVLGVRLPPSVDAQTAARRLIATLTERPPHGAKVTATSVQADGWVAPALEPWLRDAIQQASTEVFGREPGFVGEGGSIPFLASLAHRFPSVQFLATGVLGPGSNAHGPDESLHLPTAARLCDVVAEVLEAHARWRLARPSAPRTKEAPA